ncbi:GNAT family N-acetyltransferase [Caulobacter hibisci]|uniref:GNAT family N-acetyltransferase n=1 Tax=Caulobacter hibisci TaxID=2035993 RepID=A0ABS0T392_9CAUL|nr:GNAT family N-acetyltransferase [Caulobacter hibisci]MBI1686129.1 GNAT family N-acetyltransferase [Caulobacter hibisci]
MKSPSSDAIPVLPETLLAQGVALRPITDDDAPLLARWHAAFRAASFPGWNEAQLAPMLADQFRLQQLHYARVYPDADHWLAAQAETPIGQIHIDRTQPDWRLVDLLVAPDARGSGLGGALLGWIQRMAIAENAASITLDVAIDNTPARALYRKAGFVDEDPDPELVLPMRWTVPG